MPSIVTLVSQGCPSRRHSRAVLKDVDNSQRAYTNAAINATTHQLNCLSFCPSPVNNTLKYLTPAHSINQILPHSVSLTPTALHIPCKILNPGLLAVAEQSAAHHGLFVHDQEAQACTLCIHIPAHRRLGRSIRHRHLRGPPTRTLVTAEQRAKSRGRPRIALDDRNREIRSVAATRAGGD